MLVSFLICIFASVHRNWNCTKNVLKALPFCLCNRFVWIQPVLVLQSRCYMHSILQALSGIKNRDVMYADIKKHKQRGSAVWLLLLVFCNLGLACILPLKHKLIAGYKMEMSLGFDI